MPCRRTADVLSGATSAIFPLSVKAPPNQGQYTLRLDLAHVMSTGTLWASDWATPQQVLQSEQEGLTSDSTRWTGTSAVERDEFAIAVTTGGAQAGRSVGNLSRRKSGWD